MMSYLRTKEIVKYGITLLVLLVFFSGKSPLKNDDPPLIQWKTLLAGLDFTEISGPHVSKFADSKVSILKINPKYFDFNLVLAKEFDSNQRTLKKWCDTTNLIAGINAGMYSLKDHKSATGFMQNYKHINNPVLKDGFNAMAVFNRKTDSVPAFQIIDMVNQDWKSIVKHYNSCFQSIRLIDNNRQPIFWKKKPILKCSMTLLAMDKSGNVLFLFSRSPYNANEMINFMLKPSLNIQTAMYLEGGPEASLYVKTQETEMIKFGSYVSYSNPNDDNVEIRTMPNILGIRKK